MCKRVSAAVMIFFVLVLVFVCSSLKISAKDVNLELPDGEWEKFEGSVPDDVKDRRYYEWGSNKLEDAARQYWEKIKK